MSEKEMSQEDRLPLEVQWLGRRPYAEVHAQMLALREARSQDEVSDQLLLVEHDAIYTRGRRLGEGEILDPAIEILDVERGGQITWHGPGQLVAYPILKLQGKGRDLHALLRLLEDVIMDLLAAHDLEGTRDPQGTGVFVSGRKIASIGIAVKSWTSYHGLALNVTTDLGVFEAIRPCGLDASVMTTLARELAPKPVPGLPDLAEELAHCFEKGFSRYPRA